MWGKNGKVCCGVGEVSGMREYEEGVEECMG